MAFIKVDPNQNKTVALLLFVLAAAVAVTVARMIPKEDTAPPEPANRASASKSTSGEKTILGVNIPRNPFTPPKAPVESEQPNGMEADMMSILEKMNQHSGAIEQTQEQPNAPSLPKLNPFKMELKQIEEKPGPGAQKKTEPEKPKPTFTLLGTVKSATGVSGVIKSDSGKIKVVEVGDAVQDELLSQTYKVVKIENDRAVLTDGRDKIIAERPRK